MKQEALWGGAAVVAIATVIGISSTSSPQQNATPVNQVARSNARSQPQKKGNQTPCSDLLDLFHAFWLVKELSAPGECRESGAIPAGLQPKFIIATLPDPIHTHFSLLFDRFVEAIQQSAQDEGYEYDSSWLPWETEESSFKSLQDQDEAEDRKKAREDQPGVLLFRNAAPSDPTNPRAAYQEGLIVFIVGEDPTNGIHRMQFENAVGWITALRSGSGRPSVAMLGPTFSGSFPSLSQLLSNDDVRKALNVGVATSSNQLQIFSGSTTSNSDARQFSKNPAVVFHSFLQDDDTVLDRFCRYVGGPAEERKFDLRRIAILSEDETAYGYDATPHDRPESAHTNTCEGATWLYYPRDISTLRAAYQKQSMFSSGSAQPSQDSGQRKSLPTDLADPEGEQHDTVRTYAGNQTPLSQEAQLLGIVGTLRSHRAQYVVLRSSNNLDPLFLANFLRREDSEARVVILNSDLLFQRGEDAMQLSGVMTLSTYPLFPLEREWTARPPFAIHSHRVFPENSTEATYIASRLLLRSFIAGGAQTAHAGCSVSADASHDIFLPSVVCQSDTGTSYVPLPDYAPPFWTEPLPCGEGGNAESCKPATWLSVITRTGSWPLAALNEHTLAPPGESQCIRVNPVSQASNAGGGPEWPPVPLSMKLLLSSLFGLALFHLSCCRYASFTAKPAFRAHFATHGWPHRVLILLGSYLIALMALLAGWACGIFSQTPGPPTNTEWVRYLVVFVWIAAGLAVVTNILVVRKLNADMVDQRVVSDASFRWIVILLALAFCFLLGVSFRAWVCPIESALSLASRVPAYWRSMNLTSAVSPLVPFLALTLGLYIWFWYSLHGLALFGPDRPRLPHRADLIINVPSKGPHGKDEQLDVLPMFSWECAAEPAEAVATPLAPGTLIFTSVAFVALLILVYAVVREVPVRSLGARTYAIVFCIWLDFCFSLILGAGWQLWRTWSKLRTLLVFLDRIPLRRTLGALRGYSWGTVWRMSGNVLDVRYKLLSRQLESLNHLHASLEEFIDSFPSPDESERQSAKACLTAIEETHDAGTHFARWYAVSYQVPQASGLRSFDEFQERIAATSGLVLTTLLIPEWKKEKHSLILVHADGDKDKDGDKDERKQAPPESGHEHIRNAEELTCLTYLGFAQNILGRIRTIALGALFLFVAATLAVSNYPFDPRPALSAVLLLLFLAFGAMIVFVYADMHRDSTLSHITNSNPGELGSEFWFKIIGFGAAPLLGLITAIFPDISSFLFSWLAPGLSSLK